MNYRVNFSFTNENLTRNQRNILVGMFVSQREAVVNELNPCYDKWNNEFESIKPDFKGDDIEYLKFIKEKQEEIVNTIDSNLKNEIKDIMEIRVDDECDLYGYSKRWDTEVHLYLTQIFD